MSLSVEQKSYSLAFALGALAGAKPHFAAIPEALALGFHASEATLVISQHDVILHHYVFSATGPTTADIEVSQELLWQRHLSPELKLKLSIRSAHPFDGSQTQQFEAMAELIHKAIAVSMVHQNDRTNLGQPFARLTDREWQVVEALETADGEKQIAANLNCTSNTLHSYVKNVYRKLPARSRLELIHMVRRARARYRGTALRDLMKDRTSQPENEPALAQTFA